MQQISSCLRATPPKHALIMRIEGTSIARQSECVESMAREQRGLAFTALMIPSFARFRSLCDRMLIDGVRGARGGPLGSSTTIILKFDARSNSRSGGELVADTLAPAGSLFELTADRAALTTGADSATADLIDASDLKLPTVASGVGDARLPLVHVLASGQPTMGERISAAMLAGESANTADGSRVNFESARRLRSQRTWRALCRPRRIQIEVTETSVLMSHEFSAALSRAPRNVARLRGRTWGLRP
jgi:hypothetical protein